MRSRKSPSSFVPASAPRRTLGRALRLLTDRYGPTHWWPGDSGFEIAVGAILTQNTAWTNVEKAIANLKAARLMSAASILNAPPGALEQCLRPSGYFRVKAKRLTAFCAFLQTRYRGSIKRMSREPLEGLRAELLEVHGIGPETADDILLYACEKPVFVVDAYTRRILGRHGLVPHDIGYETLRAFCEEHLARDLHTYKEFHGLIVYTGKDFCRPTPRCAGCPLEPLLGGNPPLLPVKS